MQVVSIRPGRGPWFWSLVPVIEPLWRIFPAHVCLIHSVFCAASNQDFSISEFTSWGYLVMLSEIITCWDWQALLILWKSVLVFGHYFSLQETASDINVCDRGLHLCYHGGPGLCWLQGWLSPESLSTGSAPFHVLLLSEVGFPIYRCWQNFQEVARAIRFLEVSSVANTC